MTILPGYNNIPFHKQIYILKIYTLKYQTKHLKYEERWEKVLGNNT